MTAGLPTGRTGRVLAAGLLALVLALGWRAERALLLSRRQDQALRMAQLAQELPELERQAMAHQGPDARAVLPGGSDAVAAAALQQAVQDMAVRAGATISSMEALPAEQVADFRRIRLRVSMAAPWPVVVRMLGAASEAWPPMLVDELQVHGSQMLTGRGAAPLEASWTVIGFRAAPGRGPT